MYRNKSVNLKRLGFSFDNEIQQEYLKIQSTLYSLYHVQCGSMLTIMKQFGIPSSRTMDILFRLFDIEARSLSDSNTNSILQNRSDPSSNKTFTNTYHTSWCNIPCFLRSSYELEYAKILDENKIVYHVEALRIKYFSSQKNGYRIAIPDFYLPETNTITEVKSEYWLDQENMIDKAKAYRDLGYNFDLYLDHTLIKDWWNGWDSNPRPPD
jgi:hypothetical protein